MPLLVIFPLLVNGEYTEGVCVNHYASKGRRSKFILSIVEFKSKDNYIYHSIAIDNFIKNGEKVTVVYDASDPQDNQILTFTSIYLSLWSILSGIALVICTALYYAARDDKYERAQKNKWTFKNPWKRKNS